MTPHELLILRHGETVWNAEGRMQGGLDSDLTSRGREQAKKQNQLLKERDLSGFDFFVSPLGRTQKTAAIALDGLHVAPVTDLRLREIEVGKWSGRLRSEILAENPALEEMDDPFAMYSMAPEGESFGTLEKRCTEFLDELSGPSVLITHGMTSRMLRVLALGLSMEAFSELPGGQGVIYRIKNGTQEVLGGKGEGGLALTL